MSYSQIQYNLNLLVDSHMTPSFEQYFVLLVLQFSPQTYHEVEMNHMKSDTGIKNVKISAPLFNNQEYVDGHIVRSDGTYCLGPTLQPSETISSLPLRFCMTSSQTDQVKCLNQRTVAKSKSKFETW